MHSSRKFFPVGLFLLSLGVALNLVSQPTSFFGRAVGTQANFTIDTSIAYEENYYWRNFAQGGEDHKPMLGDAYSPLIETLQPEYIRLDHIYDFYNVVGRGPSGELTFNWTNLDIAVNQITAVGAKPFFALSYMPPALAAKDTDKPNNWSDWELVVQRTIEHYSGELKLADIYYEVWNEPDLFGEYKTYGPKNYLDLYSHSAVGAARARGVLPYKLGGPATTALYANWFHNFVNFVESRNLKLDFYSWHRYSTDPAIFESDVIQVKRWLLEETQNPDLELIITEMGHNSAIDPGYDTQIGAMYTLAQITAVDGVNKAFSFELVDGVGPQKLWGRWGLLTNTQFGVEAKPRYKAFEFMNTLVGGRVNIIGQGTWVKSIGRKQGSTIRLLVTNFDPAGKHVETTPLRFLNLEAPAYTLKRTDFQGRVTQKQLTNEAGSATSIEYFAPNTAAIFELTPVIQ
jgi:hypothetical protein